MTTPLPKLSSLTPEQRLERFLATDTHQSAYQLAVEFAAELTMASATIAGLKYAITDVINSANTITEACDKLAAALSTSSPAAEELVKDNERLRHILYCNYGQWDKYNSLRLDFGVAAMLVEVDKDIDSAIQQTKENK